MERVTPVLGVADVGRAVAYFVEKLGFQVVATHGGVPEAPAYGIVRRGAVAVHLQARAPRGGGERDAHETDAYVDVDDVDALLAEFRSRGVELHREIVDNDYGMRDFCVETPDGLRVAFGSPVVR